MKTEQELVVLEDTIKKYVMDSIIDLAVDEQAIVLGALTAKFLGVMMHITSVNYHKLKPHGFLLHRRCLYRYNEPIQVYQYRGKLLHRH